MASQVYTIAREPETNDIYLNVRGDFALVAGKEAYSQIVDAKMKTTIGEVQLNLAAGLPYFETVFSSGSLVRVWESEAVKMLEGLDFVRNVDSFDCAVEENVVKYTAEIRTDSGVVKANG